MYAHDIEVIDQEHIFEEEVKTISDACQKSHTTRNLVETFQ